MNILKQSFLSKEILHNSLIITSILPRYTAQSGCENYIVTFISITMIISFKSGRHFAPSDGLRTQNAIMRVGLARASTLHLGKPTWEKSAVFFNIVQTGGGEGQTHVQKLCCKFGVFWRSFNNMKFAWKGTFEALMVKFEGKIGTLYQIFTPCTPLPKYALKNSPHDVQTKGGGGQRPFEQC